jgi:oligopeptide transport system substrate-binding protein
MTFLDLWTTDSSFNTGKYSNERFDQLITQAKAEVDEDKRMQQMEEAEKILVEEDAGVAPMFFEGTSRLIEPFIKDFVYIPYGGALVLRLYKIQR